MTSWSSSIKIWLLTAYRNALLKICHGVKQNVKIGETECSLYLRRTKKRKKVWWRGTRERIENRSRERIEIERKETKWN